MFLHSYAQSSLLSRRRKFSLAQMMFRRLALLSELALLAKATTERLVPYLVAGSLTVVSAKFPVLVEACHCNPLALLGLGCPQRYNRAEGSLLASG
jgi:hypothetical protein